MHCVSSVSGLVVFVLSELPLLKCWEEQVLGDNTELLERLFDERDIGPAVLETLHRRIDVKTKFEAQWGDVNRDPMPDWLQCCQWIGDTSFNSRFIGEIELYNRILTHLNVDGEYFHRVDCLLPRPVDFQVGALLAPLSGRGRYELPLSADYVPRAGTYFHCFTGGVALLCTYEVSASYSLVHIL